MSDLLMLCPSRGRPAGVADLLDAWAATSDGTGRLLVAVDLDDPELPAYRALLAGHSEVTVYEGPRERLGPTLNRLAALMAPHYFAIGFLGDDHRPRTPGWDGQMVAALRALGTGVVYGNDLLQGENLASAVAMTADIPATLGYMAPPGMIHLYLDNFWMLLGSELGRLCYLPGVVIEHLHPVAGKAEWDAGYREVNAPERYDADLAAFARWVRESSAAEIAKLARVAA